MEYLFHVREWEKVVQRLLEGVVSFDLQMGASNPILWSKSFFSAFLNFFTSQLEKMKKKFNRERENMEVGNPA